MKYTKVYLESFGYELAPVVVTSDELEVALAPVYATLRIATGQLEALTGITERRWWEPGHPVSAGALAAARKALAASSVDPAEVRVVAFTGVCRDQMEPATACRVAAGLGVHPEATVYDLSNACLGVMNGILDVANRIELGQIRAGLVVSCESAREINEIMIRHLREQPTMELFTQALATLTGGSGAAAVLLTDGSFPGSTRRRRLAGGVTHAEPRWHELCRWGFVPAAAGGFTQWMSTDSVSVLKHGVELGQRTWNSLLQALGWTREQVDRVICHQVGSAHQSHILRALGIPAERDFSTFPFLGNMGTVSLPLTAAIAEQRNFLLPGNRVGFLGIGSGLNCLMLGWDW